ncbi:MAG: glutamine--tRNA ligase/YqeY domain fusion protein [Gammaproteobacteria bacterium]|nr:glutamine--tRNA ligase/YqeY domain fusion protein [Gammaproteobacteria bacterium]
MPTTLEKRQNFILQTIEDDLSKGKHSQIVTRFPPEPNGYLHVGHAKSICLNFGISEAFRGKCYLRMDDTNPIKEEDEYARAIIEDVQWLGFKWEALTHASDYYQLLYDYAIDLIKQGDAYVESLSIEEIRASRGTLQEGGKESPYRTRSIEENLDLFTRMKAGEFPEGTHVLRAKIDMQSGNINMRDPVLYRIRYASHQRTGNDWCIYPMYDYAHPISDAIEGVTHSLCTLEFQDHRPLYDWCINKLNLKDKPRQIEFARLNLSHTITSKRKLRQLVEENHVSGWNDPRMPTLQGMRQRGYPPAALRQFCELIGISKSDSVIDMSVLEECVRDDLNKHAPRAMAVLNPLKVVIENLAADEELTAANHPQSPEMGQRTLPFSREIWIEQDDFMEIPPPKYNRLSPDTEVRLRNAYVIKCNEVIKDNEGKVIELRCTYDPATLGKNPEGRKVQGVIHWVSAKHAVKATVNLYDRLFTTDNPGAAEDFVPFLNPNSLVSISNCQIEPSIAKASCGHSFQFERLGYFVISQKNENELILHRIVSLRDAWNKKI